MRKLIIALVVFASAAAAEGLQKWTTPGGGIYFGISPPPGSLPAGEDMLRGTVSCDDRVSVTSSREVSEGGGESVTKWELQGTARNSTDAEVRNLIVCAKDVCDRVSGAALGPGASVSFTLDVTKLKGHSFAQPYKVGFRCQER